MKLFRSMLALLPSVATATSTNCYKKREVWRPSSITQPAGIYVGPTDGKIYVASPFGLDIKVIDPNTGEITRTLGITEGVVAPDDVFVAPDGTIYWTDTGIGKIGMYNPTSGLTKQQFVAPGVNSITMSDDGETLFVGCLFITNDLWRVDPNLDDDPVKLVENAAVNGLDFYDGSLYGPGFFAGFIFRFDPPLFNVATPVSSTSFSKPSAVKFNSAGEMHVVEIDEGRISKASGSSFVEVVNIPGTIDNLAFGDDDTLYFTAAGDGQVISVEEDGSLHPLNKNGFNGPPSGLTIDEDDKLYVADSSILKFSSIKRPRAVFYERASSISSEGDSLIVSQFTGTLLELDSNTGEITTDYTVWGSSNAIYHAGSLVAAVPSASFPFPTPGKIVKVEKDGDNTITETLVSGLETPVGLASDGTTLYVSDWAAGTITAYASDFTATIIASGLGKPEGIALDGDRLLVVEELTKQVSAIDLSNSDITVLITDLEIGFKGNPEEFGVLNDVAVDDTGKIYANEDLINTVSEFRQSDICLFWNWIHSLFST